MKMLFWNMHWRFVSYRVPATDSSSAKYLSNLTDLSALKKKTDTATGRDEDKYKMMLSQWTGWER